MAILALLVIVAALGLALAWNFYPPLRERTKGWTTLLEAAMGAGLYIFDQVSQGLQEAVKAGWVPKELVVYLPLVFFAWVILKRFQTKAPIGKKI